MLLSLEITDDKNIDQSRAKSMNIEVWICIVVQIQASS